MSPRPRSPQKEDEILAAATALFAERGYQSVTVADVASTAGVGLGTLYLRFPSKEALGGAVLRSAKAAYVDAVLANWPAEIPPRDQFTAYWQRMTDFTERHPAMSRYLARVPAAQEMDADAAAYRDQLNERTAALVRGWIDEGSVRERPMEVVAALIHGTFWHLADSPAPAARRRELLGAARESVWQALTAP
jgi:AcrR family transcriptional regulator